MGLLQDIEEQARVDMQREGIRVTGYLDGLFKDGSPLEVKSYYGDYQAKELEAGKPRVSYLKQLAQYMDCLNAFKGILLYIDRGTGRMHEFTLLRDSTDTLKFRCNGIEFDLSETYKRWAKLYKENVAPKIEPSANENGLYKMPIDQIRWSDYSVGDIGKARNNLKVIGSDRENGWKNMYSPYLDLILQRQGVSRGYSDEELGLIRVLTKGFSSKKK